MKTPNVNVQWRAAASAWLFAVVVSALCADQVVPDLKKVAEGIGSKIAPGANPQWETNVKGKDALHARGPIWLENVNFGEGIIECDILGKSEPRGSNFPGIAFHGADDTTYDCV